MASLGRWLIGLGLALVLAGVLLTALGRLGLPSPGRLPGDVAWRGRSWVVFLPLGTSLALSVLVTAVLWILSLLSRH